MRIPLEDSTKAKLTLHFGQRYPINHALKGKPHLGVDFTPILKGESLVVVAPCASVVIRAGYAPNFGYHVRLKDATGRIFILGHLYATPIVKPGESLNEGCQIGWVRDHLHIEVRNSDVLPPPKNCRQNFMRLLREETSNDNKC